MDAHADVSIQGASKWYGHVIGVNGVDLEIGPGLTGLLGPNGAGKSTLMRLITGQLRPSLGSVNVLGAPVWSDAGVRRRIGFAPDGDHFPEDLRGADFVYAMARLSGLPRRDARLQSAAAIERLGMAEAGRKRLRQCSKGMRQRLKLAQALVHDPQVLVLDEPLTGIDPPGRRELLSLFLELRRRGKTVLVSSHILEEVEAIADHVILMAQGRVLAAGAVEEIRRLLAKHPLTVRVKSPQARRLAALVVADDGVAGVALESSPEDGEAGILTVRIHDPERFFRELPGRIAREKIDVEALEALDAGAAAIFDYLIEGRSSSAR